MRRPSVYVGWDEIKERQVKSHGDGGAHQFVAPAMAFKGSGRVLQWDLYAAKTGTLIMQVTSSPNHLCRAPMRRSHVLRSCPLILREQVWRKQESATSTYQLICENKVTARATNKVTTEEVTSAEQCIVRANDVIGWYHDSDGDILWYTSHSQKDEHQDDLVLWRKGVHPGVEGVYQFGRSKDHAYREYSVRAKVQYF